jgi:polysaccharide export outer membrane protein
MRCAKVFIIVLLVQSLGCVAQDQKAARKSAKSYPQEIADAPAHQNADPAKQTQSAPESYKIGPGDLITITVWKENTLTGTYLVRPDGMISISLVGDVQASALTPQQLAGNLEAKLKEFIQNPNVTVQVNQVHSKVIYLLGEVAKKGPIDMVPEMTLLQAISCAGGLTDYANAKKIYILRNDSGKQVKIPCHYKDALKGDSSQNLVLQPGDTIVVP